MGKRLHRSEYIFPSLVVLGSKVVQYTTFVFIFSFRYVSIGFSLVDCNSSIFLCRCPIVVFLDFSRCFLMSFSVRPGQVFRKPCLVSLKILAVVGLKSNSCKYWGSSGFEFCSRNFLTTFSDCCGTRGNSHIPVFLFLFPLIISSPFFWMEIYCLSSVMMHPSSHRNPNNINGAVCIFGKMGICLACFLRPGSWSDAMCVDSIVLPSGSLVFISFSIIIEAIVEVACLYRCIFAPESVIAIILVLVGLGGVSI